MTQVIGYDPGFGNTKVCVDGVVASLQSAVARPKTVGLAAIGMKTAAKQAKTVTFDGDTFSVGTGSWNRGEALTSLDYNSLVSPGRLAMFYAALDATKVDLDVATLVIGLPVSLLQDESQAKPVISALKLLKREHSFVVGGREHLVTIDKIKVLAQPVGAYMDWLYTDEMKVNADGKNQVAVIDIGFNTLDIYAIANGQVLERHIGGAEVGVYRLLERLASDMDLAEADALLRSGALNPDGQLSDWLGDILSVLKRTMKNMKHFAAVIPTGGGAVLLGDQLKLALAAKGANVYWPTDPVTSNVKGFWKYGVKNSR